MGGEIWDETDPDLAAVRRVALFAALVAWPLGATASPASALRDYETGRYDEALKSYEELLQRKGDDPRLRYNAGAAAYRNGAFDEAAKQFGEATTAPDLKLQEHAYYNLGNTLFRAGERLPDPQKKTESWEKALQQYDRALKLNTNNADARFNQAFVKKKLEELKEQQQQQSDKKQDKQDQKDQKDQKQNQQNQQDQKQDQKQDQQSKQDEQKNQQNPQQDQQQKKDSLSEQQKQPGQEKPEQPQPQPSEKQEEKPLPSEEQQREAQAMAAGQMTPRQAKQLLDSLKGDEQLLWFKPEEKSAGRPRSTKDW